MFTFFNSLIVLFAISRTKTFGMGVFIFLPWAITGLFIETYFELIINPVLISYWGVIGWCVFGLLTGLSADISFKLLSQKTELKENQILAISGLIMSMTFFLLNLLGSLIFYKNGVTILNLAPGTFLGVAYFGMPWMLINGFFGGYTAHALNKDLK